MKSNAGQKLVLEMVKSIQAEGFALDRKTKDSIKKGIKVEIIPEVRDQFLKAVQEKIEDSAQSAEDNIQSQVRSRVVFLS